jgi:hypothetical protein
VKVFLLIFLFHDGHGHVAPVTQAEFSSMDACVRAGAEVRRVLNADAPWIAPKVESPKCVEVEK